MRPELEAHRVGAGPRPTAQDVLFWLPTLEGYGSVYARKPMKRNVRRALAVIVAAAPWVGSQCTRSLFAQAANVGRPG